MAMLVTTVIDGTMKLYDLMQNNRLDAAFVNDSTVINKNIYQFTPIVSSPFCAIVNTLDSLPVKEEITPADLAGKKPSASGPQFLHRQLYGQLSEGTDR